MSIFADEGNIEGTAIALIITSSELGCSWHVVFLDGHGIRLSILNGASERLSSERRVDRVLGEADKDALAEDPRAHRSRGV